MFWDFLSLVPESVHQVLILFSDRGTPYGFRNMNGYGSHTFRWVNDKNEVFYVKLHFKTLQGIKNLTNDEALALKASNPDHATKDLFDAISRGDFPKWRLEVQIMPERDAEKYAWNVFDVTKVWPHKDYPPQEVGILTLDKNPTNYFAEVEQAAFSPSNMIPGMEPSNDKMLQGRLFSYPDTHRHRLGPNFAQLPINCPYASRVYYGQRDGLATVSDNMKNLPNYEPNSTKPFAFSDENKFTPQPISGTVGRFKPRHPNSDFQQPGDLYRKVMNDEQKNHLIGNICGHLKNAKKELQERQTRIFHKCDPELGLRVAKCLGLSTLIAEWEKK